MTRLSVGRVLAAIGIALILILPLPAAALADEWLHDGSVVIQANTDLTVPEDARHDTVVVFSADATILGDVETVVVVDGTATRTGARVASLVVAGGVADVGSGSTVDEVRLIDSTYHAAPDAVVGTQTTIEPAVFAAALAPLALAMWLGFALAYVLAGLVVAAIAGGQLRRAGASITERPGSVALGAVAVLIGLPLLIAGLAVTVVGIPTAILLAVVVLPLVWFLGSLTVAVRIGDWVLLTVRGRTEAYHPLLAAFIGTVIIGLLSIIPVIGFLLATVGAGAILVLAWGAAFGEAPRTPTPAPRLDVGPAAS